jgi:hypothetical protein
MTRDVTIPMAPAAARAGGVATVSVPVPPGGVTAGGIAPTVAVDVRASDVARAIETATVTVYPRPLTPGEETLVGLIAALGAQYAEMHGASPELTLVVGLVLYLLLREFTRRFLPPSE